MVCISYMDVPTFEFHEHIPYGKGQKENVSRTRYQVNPLGTDY
jgi:hypothetical protein